MNDAYHYNFLPRKEMLPFVPVQCTKILEVGCGDGSFSEQLKSSRDVETWGIELNPDIASIAGKKLDKVFSGDFLSLEDELPLNYFDCIVCNDILEHFTDINLVVGKLKMHLKSGGFIVSSLPNFRYVGNLWEILIKKDFQYKTSGILDSTHYRFFTQKSIIRMFEELGFKVLRSEGINPTPSWKVKLLNTLFLNHFSDIPYLQIATLAQLK